MLVSEDGPAQGKQICVGKPGRRGTEKKLDLLCGSEQIRMLRDRPHGTLMVPLQLKTVIFLVGKGLTHPVLCPRELGTEISLPSDHPWYPRRRRFILLRKNHSLIRVPGSLCFLSLPGVLATEFRSKSLPIPGSS